MTGRTTQAEREIAVRMGCEAERLARSAGLTQRGVSIKANDTPETVRQMKRGHMPDSIKLYRLADVLGVSMHDLMRDAIAGTSTKGGCVAKAIIEGGSTGIPTDNMLSLEGLGPAARLALMTLVQELRTRD